MKKALITGITGQDGSYLADLLLEKGYEIHGIVRRTSTSNLDRLKHILNTPELNARVIFHLGDLTDATSLKAIVAKVQPDEVYNLGAMSHVRVSFDTPESTADINALGTLRLLEAVKSSCPNAKFYQASTSELYGKVQETPQTEKTPFTPRSPYAISKLFAYWSVVNYREAYNLFACNGILFNHESPRRGDTFVTRKITLGIANIKMGLQEKLVLGNLDAKRDWGYAKDFVEGMWLMLQQNQADDYVLATGQTSSVRSFVELGFKAVGIDIEWTGKGLEEVGVDAKTGTVLISISPEFFRPTEVDLLCGNPSKARIQLGWEPKTNLQELASMMVQSDLDAILNRDLQPA